MKGRFRFPIPFAVIAAACTTGCCSFCIRTPGPEFWEGVHEAYSTDRDPAFSVARLAANPAVDRRVDWLERWGGDPDLSLLNGARWRARSIRPEDYPDADEISLLEWEETGYWTNGTYATQWTTLSKILTQRGLENNRTFSFSNDDFYGSTTVLVARVHSPDGSRRDIDLAANLAEAVDTGSLASNIHDPNEKTFTLALPGLQVGDAIELSMRRVAKKPRCEGVYSDYLTFESDHPSLLQVVRITGPASMPLRSRAFRDAGPVSLEHAAHTNDLFGTITEVWLAGETPRYFAEPDMPPAYDCTARLLLSTSPDWESLSRWYARLCAPHIAATNAAMADKVASILRDVVAQDRAESGTELIHRMYSIRPEAAERILPDGSDWKEFLAAHSVGWPEGSSVRYLPSLGKFVVKNTVENLGKIERLFGQFNLHPFNPAWATPGSYQITSRSAGQGSATSLDSHAEDAEDAELSGGDAPTARPPESTVVQSSREAVLANGFGWACMFQLPGASAEETEERVGKPLERAFATIEGIRNVSVRIKEGSGIAVAEFAPDSDRTATKTAVADAVEAARQSMPADAVVAGPVFSAVPRAAEPRDSTDAGAADNSDPLLPPEIGAGNLEPGTCEPANLRTRADDLPPATRAAVVRALFDFVSREVRYMGAMAESEAPGYEPHDVSLTFDNRYGVCRDKAALLVAMLRMAGIDAWPVLINVGPRKDAEVPQSYFNHAIVAADSGDPDDPYLLMDPTSETTRSLLPEYLCEMSYLVAREDGETIRETPPLPVEENMLRAHTVFTLNGDASADVTTTLSFLGVNDAAYRGYFASIPRDDIRAFFERLLRGVPGAVLTRWELHPAPEDLRKSPEPLVATVEYAIAEAARGAEDGRVAFLDLPDLAGSLAIASRVVGDLGLEKRRFPLVTDYPCGFEETVALHTPSGVDVVQRPPIAFPADSHAEFAESAESDLGFVDNPTVLFQDRSMETGRYRSLKLFRSRYSPEEYQALREAREAQERAGRAPILLEGEGVQRMFEGRAFGSGLQDVLARAVEPAPADDVFFESQRTTVDVSRAPEEWTVETTTRRRILTYAGQRKAGDVTLRWNPATTDLHVTNACVVLLDGTVTPIDPKLDLFTGDQEWVADAPRYPAGKITTVSFPKLAPGCTVEYTVVRRIHDRDFFSLSHDLGILKSFGEVSVTVVGTNEIARSFRVEDPYWKTIADRFPVETNATDGATTYTVRGGGPGSQIVSEPNMPPIHRLVPVLRASTQTAPERARAIAERMWELSDPAVQTNAAALARSLVATNASVREAFVALRDWCAVNLREAGPAYWDLPLAALSPADATLEARYGHEADLRILQLAMARALPETLRPSFPDDTPPDGPDEGPARSRSGSGERHRILIRLYNGDWDGLPERRLDRDPEPAFPNCYDTIAVALSESRSDGCVLWNDDYLFDGATQYAPPLSSRNRGRIYVEASSGNDWTPAWTTVDESPDTKASEMEPAYESMDGTSTEYGIALREDGSARVAVRIRHSGTDFEAFRKRYEQILPEERRRDAQRRVAALAQSARLVGEVATETPPEGPCVMRFEAEVPDFAVREGDRLVLRVPEPSPLSPPARTRRFPFRRTSPEFEGVTTVLRPPAGWRAVSVPASGISHVSRNDGFGARRDVWTSRGPDGELVFRGVLELERTEFGADRYGTFLRATLGGRGPDAATVVLEPAP